MSEKNVKLLRGQVRQVVKENIDSELIRAVEERLTARLNDRLSEITRMTREALDVVDQRSKDMQAYVVRNVGITTPTTADAAPAEPTKADDASLS